MVHSGSVEGANGILKGLVSSAPNASLQAISSRAGICLQTSPALAGFSLEIGCDQGEKWSDRKDQIETAIAQLVMVDPLIDEVLSDIERWKTPPPTSNIPLPKPSPSDKGAMRFLGSAHRQWKPVASILHCYVIEDSRGDAQALFCSCKYYQIGLFMKADILEFLEDGSHGKQL